MKNQILYIFALICFSFNINAQETKVETEATLKEKIMFSQAIEDSIQKYQVEIIYPKNYENNLKSGVAEQVVGIMPTTRDVNLKDYPKVIIHFDNEDRNTISTTNDIHTNLQPYPFFDEYSNATVSISSNDNSNLTFFLVPLRYFDDIIRNGAPFDFALLDWTTSDQAKKNISYFIRNFDCEDNKPRNYIYIYNMQGTPNGRAPNGGYANNYIGKNIRLQFLFFPGTNKSSRMPRIPGLESYYVFGRFGHYQKHWFSDDEDNRNANSSHYYKSIKGKHVKQKDKKPLDNLFWRGKNTRLFYSLVDHTNML